MKNRNTVIWIFAGGAVFIVFILYLYSLSKKSYDWSETYYINDNEPFCTSVLVDLMKTYFPENEFEIMKHPIDEMLDTSTVKRDYMFVGNTFFMSDSTFEKFVGFIERGNNAFIAASNFPDAIAEKLFSSPLFSHPAIPEQDSSYTTNEDSFHLENIADDYQYTTLNDIITSDRAQNVNLNLTEPAFSDVNGYNYSYRVRNIPRSYDWKYFTQEFVDTTKSYPSTPLGEINSGGYNFISIQFGKGRVYLYTTPIVLTNYFLIDKNNLEYTAGLFSYLPAADILWDEYSKQLHIENYSPDLSAGPLQFILSQKALRWAWYTMIAGLLLFVFFRSKRKQQIIPIIEPNINKSLEFVQTIGRMYYMRNDQKRLAEQKMKLLIYFIKEKYRLPATELNDDFYLKLNMKSQVPIEELQNIFRSYKSLENGSQITDKQLMHFHNQLDNFYKNCK